MATTINFEEIVNGDVYTFVVGSEQKLYTSVHSAVLSRISEPFAVMLSSGMKESKDKRVVLLDVDPDTFRLVLEYAYTNFYRPPVVEIKTGRGYHHEEGSENPFDTSKDPHFCGFCGSDQWSLFCWPKCKNASAEVIADKRLQGRTGSEFGKYLQEMSQGKVPFSDIRLHARLYIFATKWIMTGLQEMSLHRTHRELANRWLTEPFEQQLCDTIREVYGNTSAADQESSGIGSEMRELLLTYTFLAQEKLVKYKEKSPFKAFLLEGGEFLADFTRKNLEADESLRKKRAEAKKERYERWWNERKTT
ncbi:uncharacterized protein AB675_10658 [Cyphellophora attinorum]|uniref:BTB domain-containing protein n=1 Tax=Cyphellophora attinorum TaxID=1664694 RepID=A0A0N1H9Y1_9EURO|nr:uncharacterized protein AB675_10658 [Phialophora attinorum]KPI40620.1 hypothetical protein AB675_10658 [Phialophora attinorum]